MNLLSSPQLSDFHLLLFLLLFLSLLWLQAKTNLTISKQISNLKEIYQAAITEEVKKYIEKTVQLSTKKQNQNLIYIAFMKKKKIT